MSAPRKVEVTSYTPLPHQAAFHGSDAYLRALIGGFGSGKTLAGVSEALDVSLAYPKNFGLIVRRTYRELLDTTQRTFFESTPPDLIRRYSKRDEMVELVNGSVILFRSLDDVNKLRSLNLGWFYMDEASEVEDEDVPTMLVGRLRLHNVPWRGGWFTTNPPTQEHWLHEWFVARAAQPGKQDRYFMVQASSYENPYLPREYLEHLEREYSQQWARRYLMGEFGFLVPGTPVYGNFNEALHVVPDIEWLPDRPVYRSWDFGWHHPCVIWSQLGPDRTWHVLREFMGNRVLLHEYAEQVVEISANRFPGAKFVDVGDPAGNQHGDKDERTSIEILRSLGIEVKTRRYQKRRLIEGIDQRLAQVRRDRGSGEVRPVIQVSKAGCPILIAGFAGGYAFPKGKDGRIRREAPLEDGWFENPHDALQYAYAHIFLGGMGDYIGGRILRPNWRFS